MRPPFIVLALLAGCPSPNTANELRCGMDGHPAPQPVDAATLLLHDSPETCPRAEPTEGAACATGMECSYARPDQGSCAFDTCVCGKSASGEIVWRCGDGA